VATELPWEPTCVHLRHLLLYEAQGYLPRAVYTTARPTGPGKPPEPDPYQQWWGHPGRAGVVPAPGHTLGSPPQLKHLRAEMVAWARHEAARTRAARGTHGTAALTPTDQAALRRLPRELRPEGTGYDPRAGVPAAARRHLLPALGGSMVLPPGVAYVECQCTGTCSLCRK
jgi:hypothetical protein